MIPLPPQEPPLTPTDPSQTGPFLTPEEFQATYHARPATLPAERRARAHALNVWADDTLPDLRRARREVVALMWAARSDGDTATRAEVRVPYERLLARETKERQRQAALQKSRRKLVRQMWKARRAGETCTFTEAKRSYDRVCRRQRTPGRLPLAEEAARRPLSRTPPAQQLRLAQQRVAADAGRIPAETFAQTRRERDRTLIAANALAHALWGIHQGHRSWTPLGVKPSTAQATAPQEQRTNGTFPSPERLELQVPGEAMELHLYRAEYDALLESWGWGRLVKAESLSARLKLGAGSEARRDVDALYDLALSAAGHPNLALSWHGYVTRAFLGDVFTPHSSGTMQLASRRSGDLREAVLAIYALCRLTGV
ncbi:hypothetical protein [Deinococcus sp. QL22]|uniref:hypothetical protein n=1 Tax=Deinococcus sp. QL22 TaxID=2939437 RepID=UPI002017353A|nr:hypothetical protein [Deinococcus sp. QL22]UQN10385.1 hypothetical protein M1R55_29985 [Deinococcus sp. QL22]UQN10519.1 hypothetical protein M1R55_29310 [Deinococcus sp. QL22]